MNAEFENDSQTLSTFAVSFFILGYVIGSLITAPLSEQYGRKVVSYSWTSHHVPSATGPY